jgi:hypothetical protein
MTPKLFLLSILVFVLLTFPLIASVDASSEMWSQTYGSGMAFSLIETSDGGYALAGNMNGNFCLVKTDEFGNLEWNHTYGEGIAHSLVETSDGGYALAGGNLLVKTDEYGNMEWNQTFEGASICSLVMTSDGGYALAGVTSYYSEEGDFWLVKTDAQGNMEWNKMYGGADMEVAYSLVATSDGGYALAGRRTGLEGGVLNFYPFDNTVWLVKTDAYGNMEWNHTYGEKSGFKDAYSLVATSDGGYAIAGYVPDGSYSDFWLIKNDGSGNMQWNQRYGRGGDEKAYSMVETSDGGYALAGIASGAIGTEAYIDSWMVKTDASGNEIWSQTYGGTGDQYIYSLVETSDDAFALAGWKTSTYAGPPYFWLIKTDKYGNIPEFPSWIFLPLFLMATFVGVIVKKRLSQSVT